MDVSSVWVKSSRYGVDAANPCPIPGAPERKRTPRERVDNKDRAAFKGGRVLHGTRSNRVRCNKATLAPISGMVASDTDWPVDALCR